ncbi:hypothetical protein Drose_15860 [Dactylosporangium roseum]|uniref:Secreted protein n=1 Tax=Dactylosporangium roseum TaxID=47989 RepID=A0ABY5ZDB6_9ACTN|nr:hypothetical protein [Dactylosporangium roseum]UWZ39571.1 hypothetical protein Drose_15860 [Dactylosporangium roseum]
MSRTSRLGFVAAAAALLLGLSAGPAAAQNGWFYNHVDIAGAGVHTCAQATCPALTVNGLGEQVSDFCWHVGQSLGGTVYWDLVYDWNTKFAGWTNEHWLTDESQAARCGDPNRYQMATADEGAGMHTCTKPICAVVGMAATHRVQVYCNIDGERMTNPNGELNSDWLLVYDTETGLAGWTNRGWVSYLPFLPGPC